MDPNLTEANAKIEAAMHHFKVELAGIRAGRANPSLVENISIDAYGSRMKLVEVATIAAPESTLLTVQVWDNSLTEIVFKTLMEANLGLNPSSDGQLIRLPIPPLTAERREEFVKLVHQKQEEARIEIRQIRQDIRSNWVKSQVSGEFGEDELFRREKLLQDLIDRKTIEIEDLGKEKEDQLMEI